jgi:hypothetical protein
MPLFLHYGEYLILKIGLLFLQFRMGLNGILFNLRQFLANLLQFLAGREKFLDLGILRSGAHTGPPGLPRTALCSSGLGHSQRQGEDGKPMPFLGD